MTDSVRLRAGLPAPVGAVRRALSDEAALRQWLAEYAEAGPDRFAFWGRFTPQGEEARQRPLHRDDRVLAFLWPLNGADTTVEITLDDGDEHPAILTITQAGCEGEIAGYPANLAMTVFWSLAIGNLIDHLTGRPITPRCDHTAAELRARVAIAAPRATVFTSLLDSAEFSRWFGLPTELQPYAGGTWSISGGGPIGTVRAVEPGRLLSLREDSGVATWTLADDDGDGTALTFTVTGFPEGRPPYPGWTGWLSALSTLRRYHELDGWRPVWLDA